MTGESVPCHAALLAVGGGCLLTGESVTRCLAILASRSGSTVWGSKLWRHLAILVSRARGPLDRRERAAPRPSPGGVGGIPCCGGVRCCAA